MDVFFDLNFFMFKMKILFKIVFGCDNIMRIVDFEKNEKVDRWRQKMNSEIKKLGSERFDFKTRFICTNTPFNFLKLAIQSLFFFFFQIIDHFNLKIFAIELKMKMTSILLMVLATCSVIKGNEHHSLYLSSKKP